MKQSRRLRKWVETKNHQRKKQVEEDLRRENKLERERKRLELVNG